MLFSRYQFTHIERWINMKKVKKIKNFIHKWIEQIFIYEIINKTKEIKYFFEIQSKFVHLSN